MASYCMASWTAARSNIPPLPSLCAIQWWMNGWHAPNGTGEWQRFYLICRDCLRRWFDSLETVEIQEAEPQEVD